MSSEHVPYEPPGLVSAFTGYEAGNHGWHSYWSVHNHNYQPTVLTSSMMRRTPLWHRPELADRHFAVINVFGTHPPLPLNGYVVSYPTLATTRACYPARLQYSLLKSSGIPVIHDVSVWFSGQRRTEFVDNVLAADRARRQTVLALLPEVDVAIVNLTSIDRLSHIYWQELEQGSTVELQDSAIFRAYQECDVTLGLILDRVDDRTSLLAFSEIGFGPLRAYCSLNDVLRAVDLLHADRGAGQLEWERTQAFESVQGTNGINVNLRNRYSNGAVRPSDYEAVRSDVSAVLSEHVNPLTGLRMLAAVRRREEVFSGSQLEEAPDLVVEPADERYLPYGDPCWSTHVHRGLQSGWHRSRSYWAGIGASFGSGHVPGTAYPWDIASTLFQILDIPTPGDLHGTVLGKGS